MPLKTATFVLGIFLLIASTKVAFASDDKCDRHQVLAYAAQFHRIADKIEGNSGYFSRQDAITFYMSHMRTIEYGDRCLAHQEAGIVRSKLNTLMLDATIRFADISQIVNPETAISPKANTYFVMKYAPAIRDDINAPAFVRSWAKKAIFDSCLQAVDAEYASVAQDLCRRASELHVRPAAAPLPRGHEPCGYVDFNVVGEPWQDGDATNERVTATVHLNGSTERTSTFPYYWKYDNGERDDPWSQTNVENRDFAVRLHFPPPNTDTSSYPHLIKYILNHTRPDGTTMLNPCE